MPLVSVVEQCVLSSKSRHQVRALDMRMLLLVVITVVEITNVLVISKSITDTTNVRNFSATSYSIQNSSTSPTDLNSKWMPLKSYVSHLAQLPPRSTSVHQAQDGDSMKFAESAPLGITVERDGSHPLDYLHQQYRLQQQYQQQRQQQQSQHHRVSSHQLTEPAHNHSEPILLDSPILEAQQPCNKQKNENPNAIDQSVIVALSKHEPSQSELAAASTTSNMNADMPQQSMVAQERSGSVEDDEADDGDDEDALTEGTKKEPINIGESVPAESYSSPQTDSMSQLEFPGDSDYPSSQEAPESAQSTPEGEAAERSEAEAAEAREAEAADRAALDEQQQQQREIIKAQAESEAIAIKEQQEALLRQQNLQQKMLLRRQLSDLRHQQQFEANDMLPVNRRTSTGSMRQQKQRQQMLSPVSNNNMPTYNEFGTIPGSHQIRAVEGYNDQSTPYKVIDDPNNGQNQASRAMNENENTDSELNGDYSIRRPQISIAETKVSPQPITRHQMNLTDFGDLLPAAQGSYGSLHGAHGDYYM